MSIPACEHAAECDTRDHRRYTAMLTPQTMAHVEVDSGVAVTVSKLVHNRAADCGTRGHSRDTAPLAPQTMAHVEVDNEVAVTVSRPVCKRAAECGTRGHSRRTVLLTPHTLAHETGDEVAVMVVSWCRDWRASAQRSAAFVATVDTLHCYLYRQWHTWRLTLDWQ